MVATILASGRPGLDLPPLTDFLRCSTDSDSRGANETGQGFVNKFEFPSF
jgi:hypothetical protein